MLLWLKLWNSSKITITSLNDVIILLTTSQDLKRGEISNFFKENQITEFAIPKEIIFTEKLPLLGTGKIDYVQVKDIALGANQ